MNKILFFISSIALVACAGGSFQNDTSETVKFGEIEISAYACKVLSGGFFGLGSDFPGTVTKKDEASTLNITDGEDLDNGDYVLQADGKVVTSETSCKDKEDDPGIKPGYPIVEKGTEVAPPVGSTHQGEPLSPGDDTSDDTSCAGPFCE